MSKIKTIITLCGPSLSGKTELAKLLLEQGCVQCVSTTTRPMRSDEKDGVNYHFISKAEFVKKIQMEHFLEYIPFDENFYGVSKQAAHDALEKDKPVVIVCEPSGAKAIYEFAKSIDANIVRVFINNPETILIQRFLERYKNDSKANTQVYASRLINMMQFEKDAWIKKAMSGEDKYELILEEFGKATQTDAVSKVFEKMAELSSQAVQKKNKLKP